MDPEQTLDAIKTAAVSQLCKACRNEKIRRGVLCSHAFYPNQLICGLSREMVAAIDKAIEKGGNNGND